MKNVQSLVLTLLTALILAPAALAADPYTIDPVHSVVMYKSTHSQVSNTYGVFTDFSGTVAFDPESVEGSAVSVEVKSASVASYNSARDEHLSGPDFFNAKQFPVITFESTGWKKAGDVYEVTGELTLLGTTKPVVATVEVLGTGKGRKGEDLIGMEAKFTIKRSDFGMTYGIPNVGDEVEMTIAIEASK